ncbi:hypothetical protein EVAR_89550_1 [Eumeta japonica]|uniref:Uncharacterized protein n=1 Tax=Eumeta variegata TaxID=151549 RepID=A0A4C1ZD64_EUMVA|nr:hypothetical protein EVAR_89550_1 [Eumeta japonica]
METAARPPAGGGRRAAGAACLCGNWLPGPAPPRPPGASCRQRNPRPSNRKPALAARKYHARGGRVVELLKAELPADSDSSAVAVKIRTSRQLRRRFTLNFGVSGRRLPAGIWNCLMRFPV